MTAKEHSTCARLAQKREELQGRPRCGCAEGVVGNMQAAIAANLGMDGVSCDGSASGL
jgi:hypothetical protein